MAFDEFDAENHRQMENCVWGIRPEVEVILRQVGAEVNDKNADKIGLLLRMAYVQGKIDFNDFVGEHKDDPNIKWG